jgi:hypothetical protein
MQKGQILESLDVTIERSDQGILTEGEGSVQLTPLLRKLVFQKRKIYSLSIKSKSSDLLVVGGQLY